MTEYYRSGTPGVSYYTSDSASEPDMRQEFINTLDGNHPEIAKKQTGVIRQRQTNSSGDFISCSCVDSLTHEPNRDRYCPFCLGEGYIWDETLVTYYKVPIDSDVDNSTLNKLIGAGLINADLVVFYIRYNESVTRYDKIVELVVDIAGSPETPYQRKAIYKIERVWEYRSDNGKLEYFKIFAHREDVKWLNAPTYEDLE